MIGSTGEVQLVKFNQWNLPTKVPEEMTTPPSHKKTTLSVLFNNCALVFGI
jgi:hypothetical protein